MSRVGQKYTVTIEKISKGGFGVARQDGFVLFVPFSAPGDVAEVQVTNDKKTYAFAEIISIETPGPGRTEAKCPLYTKCGGCNLQHLTYAIQLEQKELLVRDQLKLLDNSDTTFLPIIHSPHEWRYRNRIQLKFKNPDMGFYKRGSHQIISITDCPIVEKEICQELPAFRQQLISSGENQLDRLEILLTQDGKITSSQSKDRFKSMAFSQVNRFVNQLLIDTVLRWTEGFKFDNIFDLYAGSGNFTFPISKKFSKASVIAVELSEDSVISAQDICRKENIGSKKIQFFAADVGQFLKRSFPQGKNLVILDPPRSGCSPEVIRSLRNWKDTRILYVSCDPSSLARDLQLFTETNCGWKIARIQPFDMFPQTDHVETLAELVID